MPAPYRIYITDQDVVLTKATHSTWVDVVAAIQAAANQSIGSSTPRRVFWIAGETLEERRWAQSLAFQPGVPTTVTMQSQDINLEVYGVRNSAGQRPLLTQSDAVLANDWSEPRTGPYAPPLFDFAGTGSGRFLLQSIEAYGTGNVINFAPGIANPPYNGWNQPDKGRTRPQTVILRDIAVAGVGRALAASFETPQWHYWQQRNTPNDTIIVEDCEIIEGTGTHLFYVDQIRASYFRRNKFAGANSTDMSAFRGVGMHCFVTDNVISDGNLQGTIQDRRDEQWWWNQLLVDWAIRDLTGVDGQDTYVWQYRLAPGNEDELRVSVNGVLLTRGASDDYVLERVGEATTDVVLSPDITATIAGKTIRLQVLNKRLPRLSVSQPWRTSAQPLSLQHGQKMVVEGNTLIKSEAYGGSATFDFILWQKRWAWTGGQALPYDPGLGRRRWDGWAFNNGGPSPVRGPEFCGQWNDAYWQSITDAGISMDPISNPPRMSNPHINYMLIGPNTFVIGEDRFGRAPLAAQILKAETDYPSHTDAVNPRAYYAYGPAPAPITMVAVPGQTEYVWPHPLIANRHMVLVVSGSGPIGGAKVYGTDYSVAGEGGQAATVTLSQTLADQLSGRTITLSVHPYGPRGMQSRAQCVVWPQEYHTFEGDWGPVFAQRPWVVKEWTEPGAALFIWQPKTNTNINSNIGFKRAPQEGAEFEGAWAWEPRIRLLQGSEVPDGYPDWWQTKRDPEAGRPAPDYQHMIVDVRNV
jgi:hypothetical protein